MSDPFDLPPHCLFSAPISAQDRANPCFLSDAVLARINKSLRHRDAAADRIRRMVPIDLADRAGKLIADFGRRLEWATFEEFFGAAVNLATHEEFMVWLQLQRFLLRLTDSLRIADRYVCRWQERSASTEEMAKLVWPVLSGQLPTDPARWHKDLAAVSWDESPGAMFNVSDGHYQSLLDAIWLMMTRLPGEGQPEKPAGIPERFVVEQALDSAEAWARKQSGRRTLAGIAAEIQEAKPEAAGITERARTQTSGAVDIRAAEGTGHAARAPERDRVFACGAPPGQSATPAEVLAGLEPAVRRAYLACQWAETKAGRRLEDREAYSILREEGLPEGQGEAGELEEYELPTLDTWTRQLRTARRALGEQKYRRRGRPPIGGSIVSSRDVERLQSDD